MKEFLAGRPSFVLNEKSFSRERNVSTTAERRWEEVPRPRSGCWTRHDALNDRSQQESRRTRRQKDGRHPRHETPNSALIQEQRNSNRSIGFDLCTGFARKNSA